MVRKEEESALGISAHPGRHAFNVALSHLTLNNTSPCCTHLIMHDLHFCACVGAWQSFWQVDRPGSSPADGEIRGPKMISHYCRTGANRWRPCRVESQDFFSFILSTNTVFHFQQTYESSTPGSSGFMSTLAKIHKTTLLHCNNMRQFCVYQPLK